MSTQAELQMLSSCPDVSVVIVNWNACALLKECLKSIGNETKCTHEIIVVDNASSDGSAEMVAREFPEIQLIANQTNYGFAAANNQGIRLASGKYVLLLNPDTVILDKAIDRMIDWAETRPDVGCAGCQVWENATKIQNTCFRDPSVAKLLRVQSGLHRLLPNWINFGDPEYSGWKRDDERNVEVVSGMFMLIPAHVLGEIGLLDEKFFVYAEEADLCRRIRSRGLRCVFTPVARILHIDGGGKATQQVGPRMYVQLQKSMVIYNAKHNGASGAALAQSLYVVTSAMRWVVNSVLGGVTRNQTRIHQGNLAKAALVYHIFGRFPL